MVRRVLVAPGIALGLFVAWTLVLAIPGALLLFAIIVVWLPHAWLWLGIPLVVGAGFVLRRQRWPVWCSVVVSGCVLALLVAYPSGSDAPASVLARWADFAYYRHDLDLLARQERATRGGPALAVLGIDGFGSMVHGIAYDESDEIALPPGSQSPRWLAAAADGELDRNDWGAGRLYGHYYWWDAQ